MEKSLLEGEKSLDERFPRKGGDQIRKTLIQASFLRRCKEVDKVMAIVM